MLGVYKDNNLIEKIESDKKISEVLLSVISDVMRRYPLSLMIYTRGPGSYMSIKLTYIILKTIEIVKKIPFRGCSAFALNDGKPIKAIGNLYFIKEGEQIVTQKLEKKISQEFALPSSLETLAVDELPTPDYILPAV